MPGPAPEPGGSDREYPTAVVRLIRLSDGRRIVAGMGVLVGQLEVVTCAHVVNIAIGRNNKWEQSRPDDKTAVLVEFPLLPGVPARFAHVDAWIPPPEKGTGDGDIAGLTLNESAPAGATPARLELTVPAPGSRLRLFGHPQDPPRPDGSWVDLEAKGQIGHHLLQVESVVGQTVKAQPGYSGSPVWQEATGAVVGLLHATVDAGQPERDAHVLSARQVAEGWPDQFDYLLDSAESVSGSRLLQRRRCQRLLRPRARHRSARRARRRAAGHACRRAVRGRQVIVGAGRSGARTAPARLSSIPRRRRRSWRRSWSSTNRESFCSGRS